MLGVKHSHSHTAAQCQERSLVTVAALQAKIYVGETMAAKFVVITSINIVGGHIGGQTEHET